MAITQLNASMCVCLTQRHHWLLFLSLLLSSLSLLISLTHSSLLSLSLLSLFLFIFSSLLSSFSLSGLTWLTHLDKSFKICSSFVTFVNILGSLSNLAIVAMRECVGVARIDSLKVIYFVLLHSVDDISLAQHCFGAKTHSGPCQGHIPEACWLQRSCFCVKPDWQCERCVCMTWACVFFMCF